MDLSGENKKSENVRVRTDEKTVTIRSKSVGIILKTKSAIFIGLCRVKVTCTVLLKSNNFKSEVVPATYSLSAITYNPAGYHSVLVSVDTFLVTLVTV